MAEVEKKQKINLTAVEDTQKGPDVEQMKQMIMNAQIQLVNLQNENKKLKEYLNQFEFQQAVERMKFLFKMLEFHDFFSDDVLNRCSSELTKSLFEFDTVSRDCNEGCNCDKAEESK